MGCLRFGVTAGTAVAICVAIASLAPHASHANTGMQPFGLMDSPKPGDVLTDAQAVRGWALCEDGIDHVSIFIDRKFYRNARIKVSRADVGKAHADMPNAADAGWGLELDVLAMPAGPHEIVVQAVSKSGVVTDIGDASVRIAH
jgi:hypothetical protein